MKNFILFCTALISFAFVAQDEQDPKAKAILDKVSAKTKSYKTITVEFSSNLKNKEQGLDETEKGKLIIKQKKYHLTLGDNVFICDGAKLWTYEVDESEAYLESLPEGNDLMSDPSKILTIYESGFKFKFIAEKGNLQEIKLYPNDPASKSFHTITLYVDKTKSQISKFLVHGKDGNTYTYTITKLTPNIEYPDSKFVFKKPGVEIIDNRD